MFAAALAILHYRSDVRYWPKADIPYCMTQSGHCDNSVHIWTGT